MGKLNGKVALVSGSGRGIGRSIALKLASEGAAVVVNDLYPETGDAVAEEIRSLGGRACAVNGSVAEPGFAERFVGAAVEQFGGLDIIVNNAGYTWDTVVQKMTDEQWYAMLDVHLTAPFRIMRAAQPVIRDLHKADMEAGVRNVRKVVNISSMAGQFGNAGQLNYTAGKAGIIGMTKTLAKEWGRMAVTVNCVAFGVIKTRLTATIRNGATAKIDGRDIKVGINAGLLKMIEATVPLGRAGTPEEAAGSVFMFCIPESDYVSGQVIACSGGLTGL